MGMDLITYIKTNGDEAAAIALGVATRTAAAYRRFERTPTVRQIIEFAKRTGRQVDVAATVDVYLARVENEAPENAA